MLKILKKIERKTAYKMFQIKMIHFMSRIWSKEFRLQSDDKVLIISPHPDDEVIGCAGLIQKALKQQNEVYVLMLTRGEAVLDSSQIDKDVLIAKRKEFILTAAHIMGLPHDHYIYFEWGDGKLSETTNNQTNQYELAQIIDTIKPQIIFLPHPFEVSEDHSAINETLSKSLKTIDHKIKIFYYLVHSMRFLREFIPSWRKSHTLSLNKEEYQIKRQALDAYIKPLTPFGKPYSGGFAPSLLYHMKWDKELFFEADESFFHLKK